MNNEIISFLDGETGVTEKIKKAMYDAAKQFVYIGYLLYEVERYGYYKEHGYQNVYEYAEKELGFKRSSTKNFIAISYEFGCADTREKGGIAHDRTMTLQPTYKNFKYSQLCEMLAMAPAQRERVTPEMTIKQIRKIKKDSEQEPELPPELETIPIQLPENSDNIKSDGQTSGQQEENSVDVCINNYWAKLPKELYKALLKAAGLKSNIKCIDIEIKKHTEE